MIGAAANRTVYVRIQVSGDNEDMTRPPTIDKILTEIEARDRGRTYHERSLIRWDTALAAEIRRLQTLIELSTDARENLIAEIRRMSPDAAAVVQLAEQIRDARAECARRAEARNVGGG